MKCTFSNIFDINPKGLAKVPVNSESDSVHQPKSVVTDVTDSDSEKCKVSGNLEYCASFLLHSVHFYHIGWSNYFSDVIIIYFDVVVS